MRNSPGVFSAKIFRVRFPDTVPVPSGLFNLVKENDVGVSPAGTPPATAVYRSRRKQSEVTTELDGIIIHAFTWNNMPFLFRNLIDKKSVTYVSVFSLYRVRQ